MGETTAISWTHATFNPWWGCEKVSPGCTFCYAEKDAHRYGHDVWGKNAGRRFFGDKHWNDPLRWNRAAQKDGIRRRVFCASMADIFEDREELDFWRVKLWKLIEQTPWLDWLLLTKRPENIVTMYPPEWLMVPPSNVWLGVTAENQEWADARIPILTKIPAAVRFISYEPALGPIDFSELIREVDEKNRGDCSCHINPPCGSCENPPWVSTVDWIIVGGESGSKARSFNYDWARGAIRECKDLGVACFVKQMGSFAYDGSAPAYGGIEGPERPPTMLKDYKGGDPLEWPPELRVQQFPVAR